MRREIATNFRPFIMEPESTALRRDPNLARRARAGQALVVHHRRRRRETRVRAREETAHPEPERGRRRVRPEQEEVRLLVPRLEPRELTLAGSRDDLAAAGDRDLRHHEVVLR